MPSGQLRGTHHHCGTWTRDTTEGTKGLCMALSYVLAFLGGLALSLGLPLLPANSAFLFGLMDPVGCVPGLSPFPCCPLILSSELELCEGSGDLCSGLLCVSYSVTKVHPALVCTILHSEVVVAPAMLQY